MRRSWFGLALLVLAGALALTVAARLPRRAPAPAAPSAPAAIDRVALEVADGAIRPGLAGGVLGHRLAVTIANRGRSAARVALSGYEHAFAPRVIAPGETVADTLLLDLPGEDFAWMVDGLPAGRLAVAGSHLVEGHR